MPAYDGTRFEPPAPVADVMVRNYETGAVLADVPMLLDSGADVTLLPRAVLGPLGLTPLADKHYELVGFDGRPSSVEAARLELLFCRRVFQGQFLLIDQEWGILGRNVLNAVAVLLDGPNLIWHEQPPARPATRGTDGG